VEFFESIVCFHVNKNLCKTNILVDNKKKSLNHRDFRYFKKEIKIFDKLFFLKRYFKKNKLVKYFN
jgi:hypothetical protein